MTALATRALGSTGFSVSVVGLGCNNFGRSGTLTETQGGTTAVLDAARELGVTLLDTADVYTRGVSETLIGEALQGHRDEFVIATKFGHSEIHLEIGGGAPKGSRAYIREAIEGSLRRLKTDWLDVYQLHTPDPATPIEETITALSELVEEGKILSFGHSNFSAAQAIEAEEVAEALGGPRFESAQNEFSPLVRHAEQEMLPVASRFGLGFLPYFPLYNGLLTGKFTRTQRPADTRIMRQRPHLVENAPWDVIEEYERFCADRGVTMLAATISWLLAHPSLTSVIAGATTPQQLRQNAEASNQWSPTPDDIATISRIFG